LEERVASIFGTAERGRAAARDVRMDVTRTLAKGLLNFVTSSGRWEVELPAGVLLAHHKQLG
jgi:hypothetical protein